jgi:hypothetical protein
MYVLLCVDGPDLLSKWTLCEKLIMDCKDFEIAWVIFNQVRQFVEGYFRRTFKERLFTEFFADPWSSSSFCFTPTPFCVSLIFEKYCWQKKFSFLQATRLYSVIQNHLRDKAPLSAMEEEDEVLDPCSPKL